MTFFKFRDFALSFCDQQRVGVIKSGAMSTASTRPQLQIRPVREDDAASMCEIFNEAVQDRLETFDSDPRAVDDQRLLIAAAEQDPKHPILVADVRNWIAGWVALAPYDTRIALDDIGEVFIYVRRTFRSYGVGRQLMRAIQEAAAQLVGDGAKPAPDTLVRLRQRVVRLVHLPGVIPTPQEKTHA